tara:strand:+ start:261 stop:1961 length:1701 start_codon:yes stop_codon:yes gene_type:complete
MSISVGKKIEFQRAIMEQGFYPENLPPVFTVKNFYTSASSLKLFDNDQIDRNKPLALSRYNETKRGGQRRVFSVPNPLFFVDIASYLGVYRSQLNSVLRRSSLSRSKPSFDTDFGRAIKIDSFSDFTSYRRGELSTSRYIVKTDISRFYPSIYTHSIPWAVHGKSVSKQDRRVKSTQTYTNKLDYLVRQAQDQQTIGIPVGPDTSRIIAELIASAIDKEFENQVGPDVVGARLVDDVYLGAANLEEAENLLSAYRDSIRKFELDINESKTRIFEAKQDLEPFWPVAVRREIEAFSERTVNRSAKSEMTAYLDEIIRIANEENDDGIVKYSIREMDKFQLWIKFWDCIEPYLIRVAVNFPHCLDYVARVVVWRNRRFSIDNKKWQKVCQSTVEYHAPQGNDSEVVWACWILKEIGEKLPSTSCEPIIRRCGPLAVLLAIDLAENNGVLGHFPKNLVYNRIDNNPMLGNDWLLSYEAERSFGYRLKGRNRNDYSVFGDLINAGAQFYQSAAEPFVFQGVDDIDKVTAALEDRIGLYDDGEASEADVGWGNDSDNDMVSVLDELLGDND